MKELENRLLNFKELKLREDPLIMGTRARIHYPNGYGASVISGRGSYGGDQGLYELAVLYKDNMCYTTGITDGVIGYLSPEEVDCLLEKIKSIIVIDI